ncbi:peptidase S8/S53 domain-containing protein, partial [Dunaliella salina]
MTPADVAALQEAFPSTTAAAPPKEAKISKELTAIIEHLAKQPEGISSEGLLAGIVAPKAPDGQQQLELSVQGLPFTNIKSTIGPDAAKEGMAAKAAAAAWTKELLEGLGDVLSVGGEDPCAPKFEPAGMFGMLPLTLCLKHFPAAASWLAEQGNVLYVEAAHSIIFENLQSASAMQTSALQEPLPQSPPNNAEHFPLWAAGLDGTGQIVGVADTGLDMDSCFFWDSDFQGYDDRQVKTTRTESGNEFRYWDGNNGTEHRKVQSYYVSIGNAIDDTGHGTHCAGTVAGASSKVDNPDGQPNLATGIAPGARVSIFDLQSSELANSERGDSSVRPPSDIASIFDVMHQRDVRIVSNSWGSTNVNYGSMCQSIDRYAWVYDMLIVYAAGNTGFQQAPDVGTVPAPALCKNVL